MGYNRGVRVGRVEFYAEVPEPVADGVLGLHGVEEGGAEVVDRVDAGGPPRALLSR
jgi:hypothetical protein